MEKRKEMWRLESKQRFARIETGEGSIRMELSQTDLLDGEKSSLRHSSFTV
jgi:hypothetical protein